MPFVQDWSEANDCKWERPLMLKLAEAQLLPGMIVSGRVSGACVQCYLTFYLTCIVGVLFLNMLNKPGMLGVHPWPTQFTDIKVSRNFKRDLMHVSKDLVKTQRRSLHSLRAILYPRNGTPSMR